MKKTIIFLLFVICMVFIPVACMENEEVSCCAGLYPFNFTYISRFSNNNVFLIKGIAQDVRLYGREIKIIEDLKGNFGKQSSIFVWGGAPDNNRLDDITQYRKNDTLIIFVEKINGNYSSLFEKRSEYATLTCAFSTLQLSNGFVAGHINTGWGETETTSWKELHEELQTFILSDEKPSWWSNNRHCSPSPFCFTYREIYNHSETFYIQGLVLDLYTAVSGTPIQVISDLKGNFPKDLTAFIARGATDDPEKFDNLKLYNKRDTLLMLLTPTRYLRGNDFVKEPGEYDTFSCAFSVLKLSNDTVIGYITNSYGKEQTMSRQEFQDLLNLPKN